MNSGNAVETRDGYRPDFRIGDTVIEVKAGLHSFRNLRAALLQLSYYVGASGNERAILVLANPKITEAALRREWDLIERTLQPRIVSRLTLVIQRDGRIMHVTGPLDPAIVPRLASKVAEEVGRQPYRPRQSPQSVFLVLLNRWFVRGGPMTAQWVAQTVGCSYPTVANALRRLDGSVRRFSDRKFQLWGFPEEEWQRVLANLGNVHPTMYYADRSGHPRDAEMLLRRASRLGRDDIAVGGVLAARHYYPDLNLRGNPRLDLTLHSPDGRADLAFVETLDPALERASATRENATLAVHVLRRQEALFEPSTAGLAWADRVSTLLDLYDVRLELQARQLQEYLIRSVG